MTGDQMERFLEHRAPLDRVKGVALLQAALDLLDEGAFSGSDGSHEI
jgi:hypothetical protein